jgi:hypothetical protein
MVILPGELAGMAAGQVAVVVLKSWCSSLTHPPSPESILPPGACRRHRLNGREDPAKIEGKP